MHLEPRRRGDGGVGRAELGLDDLAADHLPADLPKDPMSLSDADSLARRLFVSWLDSRS
jgi:hypothetical protein